MHGISHTVSLFFLWSQFWKRKKSFLVRREGFEFGFKICLSPISVQADDILPRWGIWEPWGFFGSRHIQILPLELDNSSGQFSSASVVVPCSLVLSLIKGMSSEKSQDEMIACNSVMWMSTTCGSYHREWIRSAGFWEINTAEALTSCGVLLLSSLMVTVFVNQPRTAFSAVVTLLLSPVLKCDSLMDV